MAHHKLKITAPNIINLWFGQDTPIRVHKIKMNPRGKRNYPFKLLLIVLERKSCYSRTDDTHS